MISALLPQSSAFSTLSCPKLPFRHQRSKDPKLISRLIPRKALVRGPFRSPSVIKCNVSGRSGQGFRLRDVKEFHPEPFWLSLSKEAFGVLRSLIVFLIEQPSQLRYIEWPSFQSTKSPILVRLAKGAKRPCNAVPVFWGTLKAPSAQVWLPYSEDCYSYSCSCGVAHCCYIHRGLSAQLSADVAARKNSLIYL